MGELVAGPHAYFLPCEAAFVREFRGPTADLRAAIEEAGRRLERQGPGALRSAYGPVPRAYELPVPDEDEARAMIERRLGAFLRARKEAS